MSRKLFITIGIHIACWSAYFLTLVLGTSTWDSLFWASLVSNNLPVLVLFYTYIIFVFPKHLHQKRTVTLIIWIIVFNALAIVMRFALLMLFLRGTLSDLLDAELSPRIFSMIRINLLFTGVSLAYWYGRRSIVAERESQQLQKEIADARLKGLMNQINPHFLYNTLSFLYTKALPLSKDLSDAIGKLSEMMRYTLGEHDADEMVSLEKEIQHLENFIQIHQLRYNNNLKISFELQGDPSAYRIMPLLLITFVENAFKHGKVNDPQCPLTIKLIVKGDRLDFSVRNKKINGIKETSSGIGLMNIKKRLALGYADRHTLNISDSSDEYAVHLNLLLSK